MRSVNDMNEEKRLFGDSENDPRSPRFKGTEIFTESSEGDPCEYCNGTGRISVIHWDKGATVPKHEETSICPKCAGLGYIEAGWIYG